MVLSFYSAAQGINIAQKDFGFLQRLYDTLAHRTPHVAQIKFQGKRGNYSGGIMVRTTDILPAKQTDELMRDISDTIGCTSKSVTAPVAAFSVKAPRTGSAYKITFQKQTAEQKHAMGMDLFMASMSCYGPLGGTHSDWGPNNHEQ